jgi:hypothetical protein
VSVADLLAELLGPDLPIAVRHVGGGRARVWRLYMAAAAVGFERDDNQIHQIVGTATVDGVSDVALRPQFDAVREPYWV